MLALGLVLNRLGIGLFCWAIFALAVYALPFFVALSVGMTALQSGASVIGALLIGTGIGVLTLVLGRTTVAVTHSLTLRIAISTAFAVRRWRRWLSSRIRPVQDRRTFAGLA